MRAAACVLIVVGACLAAATQAGAATLFTLAGVESTSAYAPAPCGRRDPCTVPAHWPRTWVATERRLKATCLTHLADGTILICQGSELLALDRNGRLRHWLPANSRLGLGSLFDADAASDGSVVVLGQRGVARVHPGGEIQRLATSETSFGTAVAAMPDGSALVSGGSRPLHLVRIDQRGEILVSEQALPVGRTARYSSDEFDDLVALQDGSVLVALRGRRQLVHVDASGRARVVAGGRRAMLHLVRRLDVLGDGTILALVESADGDTRVAAMTAGPTHPRLAVAQPATNRVSLRDGRLDVIATRPAAARIQIVHGDRVLSRARVRLHAGRNRVQVRVPVRDDALVARVSAVTAGGGVATHRLAFLPGLRLSATELRFVRRRVEAWGSLAVSGLTINGCQRLTSRSYRCRWEDWAEGDLIGRGHAVFWVSHDGLVRYSKTSGRSSRLVFEPI